MSAPGSGDAAFPIPLDDRPGAYPAEPGMTLRDYFAAKAIPGLMYMVAHGAHGAADSPEGCAAEAYKLADAMLRERAK